MNWKKIAALLLTLALLSLGAAAGAEDSDTQIADYEARIAELEAQVAELEHQLALRDYVASFDGGHVTVEEAMERYNYVAYMYQSYGYSLDGYEAQVKEDIATALAQEAVLLHMAEKLGLATPDEAEDAALHQAAAEDFDEYIATYRADFEAEGKDEEQVIADTGAFLEGNGLTIDALYQDQLRAHARQKLYASVADEIAVTDEDAKAAFESLVAADQESYEGGGYAYESAASSGADIYWNPEGYRAVKQVLIAFSDEQKARYSEINGRLTAFAAELDALDATPAPEAEEAEEAEEPAAPREADLIQADIDAANAELEALYAELDPIAQEVADQFAAGAPIDELISAYGGDPGMAEEPAASKGYMVCESSAMWDKAFTQAAMSIEAIGQISQPARGAHGIYIVYYLADVAPGPVAYEAVQAHVTADLLEARQSQAYDDQLAQWMAELNVTYHLENFR